MTRTRPRSHTVYTCHRRQSMSGQPKIYWQRRKFGHPREEIGVVQQAHLVLSLGRLSTSGREPGRQGRLICELHNITHSGKTNTRIKLDLQLQEHVARVH